MELEVGDGVRRERQRRDALALEIRPVAAQSEAARLERLAFPPRRQIAGVDGERAQEEAHALHERRSARLHHEGERAVNAVDVERAVDHRLPPANGLVDLPEVVPRLNDPQRVLIDFHAMQRAGERP